MRVLLSHYPMSLSGGSERSTLDLAAGLSKLGHSVYLWGAWATFKNYVTLAENNNIQILPNKATSFVFELAAVRRACKTVPIDAIISHSRRYNIMSHFATMQTSVVHIPVVRWFLSSWNSVNTHNPFVLALSPLWTLTWYRVLQKAPAVVCISRALAADAQAVLRCEPQHTPVIHNAIGVSYGSLPHKPRKPHKRPFKILLVGRASPEKRLGLIVPLMKEILKSEQNVNASIVGSGEVTPALREITLKSGLGNHIEILGHREDIAKCYQNADVLVHFGEKEAFGRVFLEAQINGLPVVAPRSGAAAEIVCEGNTGFLHGRNDICAMARSIITLIREDGTYLRMSQAAHKWASENFTVDKMAKEYETIIKGVVPDNI